MRKVFQAGGFVLVGGQSLRMGTDKALLELQGKPLFLRTVELLRPHVAEVALLGSPARYASFSIPVIPDRGPGRGPLPAVCTGLENALHPWSIFLACDLPFLEGRFLEFLLKRALASNAQAVVPRTADGWQPLCAAYQQSCLPVMRQALEAGVSGIVDVLDVLRVDVLAADEWTQAGFSERMFKNMNRWEDWEEVNRVLEENRQWKV